jgi:hypothetical protein
MVERSSEGSKETNTIGRGIIVIDFSGVKEIDRTQSPCYKAFQRMEENTPSLPIDLLTRIGAYLGNDWAKQPLPNFRGWFGQIAGRADLWNWEAIPADADLDDIGYVGIWRGRTASENKPIIWCALPSMLHGTAVPGESIEVGSERVRIGWKQEDLDAMVENGFKIMKQMIAEYGEYV